MINIGTLSPAWIDAMLRAGRAARARNVPIVLDPVGSGATALRTRTVERLLAEAPPTIVRGNASEIRSLVHAEPGATKGVDSTHQAHEAEDAARALADRVGCVVSVSGAVDLIVSKAGTTRVANGHPIMTRVTGMGCTASALTGAFAAVSASPHEAAVHAMATVGLAGELAHERSSGPGSFQVAFLDALYGLDRATVEARARIER